MNDDDDIWPSSTMGRTNWTELLPPADRTGSGLHDGPVWGNPRSAPTRRYEKLPYGIHYDDEDEECRNVVLGTRTSVYVQYK